VIFQEPAVRNENGNQNAALEREVGRQSKRAERAEALVDVQKKLATLLGTPFESEQ